jgi:exosortase D (VPLPA-CTERM-specific)
VNRLSLARFSSFPAIAAYTALLAGIYHFSYSWLIRYDWPREDYNYAYLIPPVVFYLVWEKRRQLASVAASPTWRGIVLLIAGILLFWAGQLAGELYSVYLSSWLIVCALLWTHWGWNKLRVIALPLLLILSMFPPPHFLNTKLTFSLKLISSQLGIALIQLSGMSAYREGNVIDLGFTQLQVVDACSGLRFFFPLILMGIFLAYFYRLRLWKGILLALSAAPLSILMNGMRIALTGIIYRLWGAAAAEGFFHGFSGWLIFMASFGVLFGEMKCLNRFSPERPFAKGANASEKDPPPATTPEVLSLAAAGKVGADRGFMAMGKAKYFLLPAALLGATLVLLGTVDFHENAPPRKTFAQFPNQVENWTGTRQTLEQKIINELDLTDYIMVDYRNSGGELVNFYVAYYQSQKMSESIHSPETCLPGSGWIFHKAGEASVSLADGKAIAVKRAVMEKDGRQMLAYFWFPARGRILTNAYQMKLFNMWDALTQRRTDGALVRVISPVLNGDRIETVEAQMQDLMRVLQPIIGDFVPN